MQPTQPVHPESGLSLAEPSGAGRSQHDPQLPELSLMSPHTLSEQQQNGITITMRMATILFEMERFCVIRVKDERFIRRGCLLTLLPNEHDCW